MAIKAQYFQNLGYFGQCGFDTILVGDSLERASIHCIECNGQWGRCFNSHHRCQPACKQFGDEIRNHRSAEQAPYGTEVFPSILAMLKDHLFSCANREGVVLLSPGQQGDGLNLMVIAESKCAAQSRLNAVERLLMK